MGWWVLFVWVGAVVLAAVVLGFCAYELSWKAKRLRSDLAKFGPVSQSLRQLQHELDAARTRMVEARR